MGEGLKRAVAAAKATRSAKLQKTVLVKDWGEPCINRLAVIVMAIEQMDERERSATFGFLKSRYTEDWPRESF